MKNLKNKNIILGICGGIAAYKVPELIRILSDLDASILCVLTANGSKFVTPLTLRTLSQNRVYEDMFDSEHFDIEHIALAKKADVFIIVPATADVIARLANGRAGDLLSCAVLSTKAPVLICPAMNENMWLHPATVENVERLKKYGYKFVAPQTGRLACGDSGAGRLADLDKIAEAAVKLIR